MELLFAFMEGISSFYATFTESWFFLVIKIFLFLYVCVLTVSIILLVYVGGGISKWMRAARYGSSGVVVRSKYHKQWKTVFERLKSDHERHWKIAVLEADHLISRALRDVGYDGDTFTEQIAQIPEGVHSTLSDLEEAHAIRNAIVHSEDYELEKDEAKRILGVYQGFLGALGAVPQKR